MTLTQSGNTDLATRRHEGVRSDRPSATNPSTKKTSPRDKSSKGQNTRKAGKSPVASGEAALMKPHATTATGGANSAQVKARTTGKTGSGKADNVLKKLRTGRGVTIGQIMEMTNWQAHSVRGFLSGMVKKKHRLDLVSEVGRDGLRRYRIVEGEGLQARENPRARKSGGYIVGSDSTIADRGDVGADSSADADSGTEVGDEASANSVAFATPKA